jgi:hypothetical protein
MYRCNMGSKSREARDFFYKERAKGNGGGGEIHTSRNGNLPK